MRQLFRELKRRNVYKVAVTYAAVAFVTLQAARLIFPATTLEGLYDELVVVAFVGFPLVLVVAWAFELTPEGVRRTARRPVEGEEPGPGTDSVEEARSPRRRALMALLALGLVGAAVAGGWYLVDGGGGPPAEERSVAVLPFEVSGTGAEEWGDGMVALLSIGLDGAGALRTISDRTVFGAWEERGLGQGGASTDEALSVAREVGARYAVVGSAVALADELRLVASVRETSSGRRLGRVQVQGSADGVTALADSLTRRLLGLLFEEAGEGLPGADLASQLTQSLPALEAYLEGDRHERAGAFGEAVEDFRRAIERDTSFALPSWRLAWASGWIEIGTGTRHLQRAYELADRLPRRERRLVRASWLWRVRGQTIPALDSLRRLARAYPDDPRVWYEMGEVILHGGLPGGWPEADRAFERAVALDPGHGPYHIHPLMIAFTLHRDSALVAERRARHPNPDDLDPWIPLALDLVFGSGDRREDALARIDAAEGSEREAFLGVLGPSLWHPRDGDAAEAYLRRIPAHYLSRPSLIQNLLRRGRREEALLTIGETPVSDTVACGLADAVSVGLPLPDSVLRAHLDPARVGGDASLTRRLCAGVYLLERGRMQEAGELIARLRADDAGSPDGRAVRDARREDVVDVLGGYRAWQDGDLERAARFLGRSVHAPSIPAFSWRSLWRGDVYRELGRLEEAEGWYLATWWHPLAHLRLGRLYEEMNRPDEAAAAYRRFIAAWKGADEPLQGRVTEARERVRDLTGPTSVVVAPPASSGGEQPLPPVAESSSPILRERRDDGALTFQGVSHRADTRRLGDSGGVDGPVREYSHERYIPSGSMEPSGGVPDGG